MKHVLETPIGEPAAITSLHEKVMPSSLGWRTPDPNYPQMQERLALGVALDIPKTRAFQAVKRVGVPLGLKAAELLLLDLLGAFSKAEDWAAGQRPIVWPSNACLMERTGFARATLKRHLRKLADTGLIAFADSPNGKRWGRRDKDGRIVEAYGLDLSPLAARTAEFEALEARLQQERAHAAQLRREITVARRTARAQLAVLAGTTSAQWTKQLDELVAQRPGRAAEASVLQEHLVRLTTLIAEITRVGDPADLSPMGSNSEPHIQTTRKLETKSEKEAETGKAINPTTLLAACPEFAGCLRTLGDTRKTWADLFRHAGALGPMIGVPQTTWARATETLGPRDASVAMALIFDKHASGDVQRPGGYLQGIVRKAKAGALHLDRSIYGRLSRQPG